MAAEEPVSRHEWLALAAILLLALVLRVIGLNAQLWYDEILTLTDFVRKPYGELVGDFSSLNNHMFYSLQARASILAFGESAWALRLPAMLYGVASLVVLWRMGREAAGRRAACRDLPRLRSSSPAARWIDGRISGIGPRDDCGRRHGRQCAVDGRDAELGEGIAAVVHNIGVAP